jgi:hypothetical protein
MEGSGGLFSRTGMGGPARMADQAFDRVDQLIRSSERVQAAVESLRGTDEQFRVEFSATNASGGAAAVPVEIGTPKPGSSWWLKRLSLVFTTPPTGDVLFMLDRADQLDGRALLEVVKAANLADGYYSEAISEGIYVPNGRTLYALCLGVPAAGFVGGSFQGLQQRSGRANPEVRTAPYSQPATLG